jgi:hypothetical protein
LTPDAFSFAQITPSVGAPRKIDIQNGHPFICARQT